MLHTTNRPPLTFWRVIGRFISGRPLDGSRRTDATFLRRATKDLTDHGRSAQWHHHAGWRRALWRCGIAGIVASAAYGYFTARNVTLAAMIAGGVIGFGLSIWRGTIKYQNYHLHHRIAQPLYETISHITGHNPSDNHKRYLTIPRDYAKNNKALVALRIPYTWEGNAQEQKRINDLVQRRLGGDWDMHPFFSAHPPRLEFRPSPAPPGSVTYAMIKPILEKEGGPNKVILGIGTHDSIASIDLDSESPHVAISMGTGGGKSSLLRLIVMQLIRHGVERIDIIDPKRISHNWAKNIPGVYIHRTMAQQMEALKNFRIRMESRYEQLEGDETLQFPRNVMLIEEQNSWISYAETYWQDYRMELEPSERARVSRQNPAISDLGFCLFQGRQSRMNIFSVYQRMSARASGGGDLRENYYAKILARFSPQTWKLLVGTVPVPRSSKINGRAKFVLGEDDKWIQMGFVTEDEAREYAALAGEGKEIITPDPDDNAPVTLREAADADIIPMRYGALRRARTRDRDHFPAGVQTAAGLAYVPDDLRAWHAARPGRHLLTRAA